MATQLEGSNLKTNQNGFAFGKEVSTRSHAQINVDESVTRKVTVRIYKRQLCTLGEGKIMNTLQWSNLLTAIIREDLKVIQYQSQEADNTYIISDGTSPYNSTREWAVKRH